MSVGQVLHHPFIVVGLMATKYYRLAERVSHRERCSATMRKYSASVLYGLSQNGYG